MDQLTETLEVQSVIIPLENEPEPFDSPGNKARP
jgi:hypothetical protein